MNLVVDQSIINLLVVGSMEIYYRAWDADLNDKGTR
jgi:hypothetical protein